MKQNKSFQKAVLNIVLPVTAQSLLQSSFSVVDQVMVGQLGSISVAGIGLAGKFASLFSVVMSAIAAGAGIMMAQYIGKKDDREVSRSFYLNLILASLLAMVFGLVSSMFSRQIMSVYTLDEATINASAGYLKILALSFLPMAIAIMVATLLRCMEITKLPLYASIGSAVANTVLNYILIFGKGIFPEMGIYGAAWATVLAQIINCILILILFIHQYRKEELQLQFNIHLSKAGRLQYIGIVLPILVCEVLWSLGENVYAIIYGHIGTIACAAMTLTNPIQALTIGALSGLSSAAGIIVGKRLGSQDYERAYQESKLLMKYGLAGALILSLSILFGAQYYVRIFSVEPQVKIITIELLVIYAFVAPVKVLNMILGGGIIRSGGKTKYVMWIDIIGTWGFGVPLGLMAAFVWKLPIPYVYLILSMEEGIRLLISLVTFKKKWWIQTLMEEKNMESVERLEII